MKKILQLADLPDDELPAIHELPGDLRQVAEICERLVGDATLAVRIVIELVQEFRGTNIYGHNLDYFLRRWRDKMIRLEFDRLLEDGASARSAADSLSLRWDLCSRQIWKIIGRPDDERQMGLFD